MTKIETMVLKCIVSHFKPFQKTLFFTHTTPLILPAYNKIFLSFSVKKATFITNVYLSTRNQNPFDLRYQVYLISDVFLQPLYLLVNVPMANNAYLPSCLSYCLIIALVILGGKNKNFTEMFNTKRKGSLRICSFPAHNCPVLYFLWLHEWTTVVASRLKNY